MMRTLSSALAITAVLATVLTGGESAGATPPPHAGPPPSLGDIAIVPLDDRPFPATTPVEIAAAGGHTALAPDEGLLGEFFTFGDADAVSDWWAATARDADASVVALPMLAYGGLMASRACETDLTTARERLEVLEDVKAADPDHPVYAFDVIQRLTIAPTSGYPGSYSGQVRRWAELIDLVENLGREDLRDEYETLTAEIPQEIRDDYLCARARNHEINKDMIRAAAAGTIDFLILGQDDASEFGPHRAEKEVLIDLVAELGVEDTVKIYPGADVLGALLTAKHVVERLDVSPTVDVEWSRTDGDVWIAPYQDIPYGDLVNEYIATLGAERSDVEDADVLLMANTSGAGSLTPFVDRIHEELARGRLVAVGDDAVAGVVDTELRSLLGARIDLAELGAWSGWNVGVSLAQSVVRAALLEASRTGTLLTGDGDPTAPPIRLARERLLTRAATAHQRLLYAELVHTDLYRNHVRADVRDFAVSSGDDPQYMQLVFDEANELAVSRTRPLAEELFATEFAGVPLRLGDDGVEEHTAVVSSLDALTMRLGWPRYQELDVVPEIGLLDEAPAEPVAAALLPADTEISPDRPTTIELTAVLRNVTAAPVEVTVDVGAPDGWSTPAPTSLTLDAFEARDVTVPVTTTPMAADTSGRVELSVTTGEMTVTEWASVTARWRNVALAAEGATVAASGWWKQYGPERAIDGNTTSVASRWITDPGPAHLLEVTFARSEPIDTVTLHQYGNYELYDYTISALVDGDWQVVTEVVDNTATTPDHQFDGLETSAVRLDVTETRDSRVRLYEIEVTCRASDVCG